MTWDQIAGLLVILSLFVIPPLALTFKYLIYPALVGLIEAARSGRGDDAHTQKRLAQVEQDLELLRDEMERLSEIQDFERQLQTPPPESE